MLLNPFASDAFNLYAMTDAINLLPNNYGRVQQLGLFRPKPVRNKSVVVELKNGVLNLLPTVPWGGPATKNSMGQRRVVSFQVPHIPLEDVIEPTEFDNIRAFGSESNTESLASVMNDHLQTMRNKFAITWEWHQMNALKGILYDSDGSTVLYNWFDQFQIKKKSVDFVFGTETTNILGKCLTVKRHIENNLHGEIMGGIHALVDKDFFDALTSHATVKAAYERWQAGAALREDMRNRFYFGGIWFEEYEGTASEADGTAHKFLTSKYGIAFPTGTVDTFRMIYAPADFLETVNTLGRPMYAKQEARKFNRGVDVHCQSNFLAMCMRPGVLVEIYSST